MTDQHKHSGLIVFVCIAIAAIGVVILFVMNGGSETGSRVVNTSSERNTEDIFFTAEGESVCDDSDDQSGRSATAAVDYSERVKSTSPGGVSAASLPPPTTGKPPGLLGLDITGSRTMQEIIIVIPATFEAYFVNNPLNRLDRTLHIDYLHNLFGLYEDRTLFDAIFHTESGYFVELIGAAGEHGPYQITEAYWHDACEQIAKEHNAIIEAVEYIFDYEKDATSRMHSEVVMKYYWRRYGAVTDEEKCRIHNGGPKGLSKQSTLNYWQNIQKILDSTQSK